MLARVLERKFCARRDDCYPDARARIDTIVEPEKRCAEGDYLVCGLLSGAGRLRWTLDDEARACKSGSRLGCDKLLQRVRDAPHVPFESRRRAFESFRVACERGELGSCELALRTTEAEREVEPVALSPKARAELRRLACQQGSARDCRELAEESTDPERAALLYEKACPGFLTRSDGLDIDGRACEILGDRELGGKRSGGAALEYYRRACFAPPGRRSDAACAKLRKMYRAGTGMARSEARAAFLDACLCSVQSGHCSSRSAGVVSEDPFHPCGILPLGASCYLQGLYRGACASPDEPTVHSEAVCRMINPSALD